MKKSGSNSSSAASALHSAAQVPAGLLSGGYDLHMRMTSTSDHLLAASSDPLASMHHQVQQQQLYGQQHHAHAAHAAQAAQAAQAAHAQQQLDAHAQAQAEQMGAHLGTAGAPVPAASVLGADSRLGAAGLSSMGDLSRPISPAIIQVQADSCAFTIRTCPLV